MTKAELIEAIAADTEDQTKASIAAVLDAQARAVGVGLKNGHAVTIPGLVILKPKDRAARTGRNPKTGASVDIPAKTVVTLKAVKALADKVA